MEIQWALVIFTLLGGAGGCLFAFIGLNEICRFSKKDPFVPALIAGILAVVGGLISITHLSHPDRIMNALSHPTSGIFTEAVLVAAVAICVIVYLILLKRKITGGARVFGVIGGIFGLLLAYMCGNSYTMAGQPALNTVLLPIGYLCTALAVGSALWWALCTPDEENGVKTGTLITIICTIVGFVGFLAFSIFSGALAQGSAIAIIGLVCEVLAIVLACLGRSKPTLLYAWLTVAAAAVAALLYRMLMWAIGGGIYGFFS